MLLFVFLPIMVIVGMILIVIPAVFPFAVAALIALAVYHHHQHHQTVQTR